MRTITMIIIVIIMRAAAFYNCDVGPSIPSHTLKNPPVFHYLQINVFN